MKKFNCINIANLHFFVILTALFLQMLDRGSPYRVFAYLNVLLVFFLFFRALTPLTRLDIRTILYILAAPIGFVGLHFLSTFNFSYTTEFQKLLLATFLACGIWIQAKINAEYVKKNIFIMALFVLFLYSISQVIALWMFDRPTATARNPHYLAFYSASCLIFSVYSFFKLENSWRWVLAIPFGILGYLVLMSSSRPTWIGLIFTSCLIMLFIEPKKRKYLGLTIIFVLSALILTNAANFTGRFLQLLSNLSSEERATIWHDAWKMQQGSNIIQWAIGHGINSFEESFKQYSQYHLKGEDFKSPHNHILELIYISGIIGFSSAIMLISYIYIQLLQLIKRGTQKYLALLLMSILTTNLITVSITVPFFSSYNMVTMAVIAGIILFLKEISTKNGA